tara:strand:- start:140 stop:457 length:318 start_codon:yes stop_codon:yes gene_type:complete
MDGVIMVVKQIVLIKVAVAVVVLTLLAKMDNLLEVEMVELEYKFQQHLEIQKDFCLVLVQLVLLDLVVLILQVISGSLVAVVVVHGVDHYQLDQVVVEEVQLLHQ